MNWNEKIHFLNKIPNINAMQIYYHIQPNFICHLSNLVTLSPNEHHFCFGHPGLKTLSWQRKEKNMNSNRVCGTKSFWEKYMHFLVFIELTVGCFFLYKKADTGLGSSTTVGPVLYVFACVGNFLNTYGIFRDERMTMQKFMAGITYRITTFLGKKLC